MTDLAAGSTYHGYADPVATPSLTYHVVAADEIDTAVPVVPNPHYNGTTEALHSHSHQLEAELNYVDSSTFSNLFEGPAHPGGTTATARCGSVHNPPNSSADYDYADATPQASGCLCLVPRPDRPHHPDQLPELGLRLRQRQ